MHLTGQLQRPGIEWLMAAGHFMPCSASWWLLLHVGHWTASFGSGQCGGRWPYLRYLKHCIRGGLGCHFLNVIAFLNIARWVRAMEQEMFPSRSRKVNEKLECWPWMQSAGHTQHGGRMKRRLVHSGLHLISLSRWSLECRTPVSGSRMGTPLKVTQDQPETGTRREVGNG